MDLRYLIPALTVVWGSGYLFLNFFRQEEKFNPAQVLCLAPVFFLVYIFFIYLFQALGFVILSDNKTLLLFFCLCLALTAFLRKVKKKFYPEKNSEDANLVCKKTYEALFGLVFTGVILAAVISAWPVFEIFYDLRGDAGRHILFANQLLTGFSHAFYPPFGPEQYADYPCFTHIVIGFFARLLYADVFYAYNIVHILSAILLPAGVFLLVNQLTKNRWIALAAVLPAVFYGGMGAIDWEPCSWLFNTSIQRLLPHHITRNLAIALVPYFLFFFAEWKKKQRKKYLAALGFVLGSIGLIHTYPFVFLFFFLCFYMILSFRDQDVIKSLIIVLAISLGVLCVWLGPMAVRFFGGFQADPAFFPQGFKYLEYRQHLLTWSFFLKHYGLVGFLGFSGLFFIRSQPDPRFFASLAITCVFVFLATFAKELFTVAWSAELPTHPMQDKFGKLFYLSCVILSALVLQYFFKCISGCKKARAFVAVSAVVAAVAFGFLLFGAKTAWNFKSEMNQRFQKTSSKAYGTWPVAEALRKLEHSREVFCVPPEMLKNFSALTGFMTLSQDSNMVFAPERLLASHILYADKDQRRYLMDAFPGCFSYADLFFNILQLYDVKYYINKSPFPLTTMFTHGLEPVVNFEWINGQSYTVYEIRAKKDIFKADGGFAGKILGSGHIFDYFLGYKPYFALNWIRPGIYSLKSKKITGLTSDGQLLWMAFGSPGRIAGIDPETGRAVSCFDNPAVNPAGIAFDGRNLWVADAEKKVLIELAKNGIPTGNTIETPCSYPRGLDWDGTFFWNVDFGPGRKNGPEICMISAKGDIKASVMCMPWSTGVAVHEGKIWFHRNWGGRVYETEYPGGQAGTSFKTPFFNPMHRIDAIAWHKGRLWAFDPRSCLLIAFYPQVPEAGGGK